MRIAIISFTRQGGRTLRRLLAGLSDLGHETTGFLKEEYREDTTEGAGWPGQKKTLGVLKNLDTSAGECVADIFLPGYGIIFIGATGIAVRLIAPLLKGKDRDPAVVVIDEGGHFAVSLLSGHLGGANDLAGVAAHILGAVPVITTATDLNDTFAVDLFARNNDLQISDLSLVKKVSAALLDGGEVGFFSELPVGGDWPRGLSERTEREWNIYVTMHEKRSDLPQELLNDKVLCLYPRLVVIGIGCRRGTSLDIIEQAVGSALASHNIERSAVACIASIDLKKEEPGVVAFSKKWRLEFLTFSAGELSTAQGTFSQSKFVLGVTGVSNVCERAAVCGCGEGGRLLMERTVISGVTVALAVKEKTLCF